MKVCDGYLGRSTRNYLRIAFRVKTRKLLLYFTGMLGYLWPDNTVQLLISFKSDPYLKTNCYLSGGVVKEYHTSIMTQHC